MVRTRLEGLHGVEGCRGVLVSLNLDRTPGGRKGEGVGKEEGFTLSHTLMYAIVRISKGVGGKPHGAGNLHHKPRRLRVDGLDPGFSKCSRK